MDEIEKATSTFHKPYSCAQAVYAAFENADDEKLAMLKSNSAGHAPEGKCGALFAAQLLAPDGAREEIAAKFAARVGDTNCREIKTKAKTPCIECVRAAVEILKSAKKA